MKAASDPLNPPLTMATTPMDREASKLDDMVTSNDFHTAYGSHDCPKKHRCFSKREKGVYLWAHWLANYPWLVILISLTLVLVLSAVAFTRPFELDSGGGGFVPRSDPIGLSKDAVVAALEYTYFTVNTSRITPSVMQLQQIVPSPTLSMMYVKDPGAIERDGNDNVLTNAAIAEIAQFERTFRLRANFSDFCLRTINETCVPPVSISNYAFPPFGEGLTQVTNQTLLWGNIPATELAVLVNKTFRFLNNINSDVVQSLYTFGYPLQGFNNSQNDIDAQNALYDSWISSQRAFFFEWNAQSSEIDVLWVGQGIVDADTDALLLNDATWAAGAVVFVVVWITFHTTSLWLSLCGVVQILLSFPVAYFFIRVAMGVRQFNTLNMLGLFIILGIGADDIFIMVDRWKQSAFQPQCPTHATRMAWAFKSAARSMFVTSFTTSMAFFCNAASTIAPIRIFGIFCGTLILVNYALVLSFYPSIVSLWGRLFEGRCLDSKLKELAHRKHAEAVHPPPRTPRDAERQNVKKMRLLERFFYFKFYPFISKFRFLLFVLLAALFLGFLVMATMIQPAQEPAQFLPDDYYLARAFDLRSNSFNSTPNRVTVNLYVGVSGVDRADTDADNVGDIGTPIWNPDFDLSTPEAQNFLVSVCEAAKMEPSTLSGQVVCPISDFRNWLLVQGRPFPSANVQDELTEYVQFYAANNAARFETPRNSFSGTELPKTYTSTLRFDNETGALRMVQMIVNTTIGIDLAAQDLRPFFAEWNDFVTVQREGAPLGVEGLMQVSDRWLIISVEDALYSNAIFGIWTSMLVAVAVLIGLTLNVFTSLIAIISIGCIVTCVIGTLVSIGWSLGVIESICLSIVTGLSVDYSAHMADSYNDSKKGLRPGRSRDMLATIGLSIFSAGITTVVSAFFLFGTTIIFFFRFGAFIAMTVGYSTIFAFFGMPTMLRTFGPQRNQGDLRWFFRNKPKVLADWFNVQDTFPDEDGKFNGPFVEKETEHVNVKVATDVELAPVKV